MLGYSISPTACWQLSGTQISCLGGCIHCWQATNSWSIRQPKARAACTALVSGGNRMLLLFRPERADHANLGASALDLSGNALAVAPRFRLRGDARSLMSEVTPVGRARLLRFLIGLGTSAFGVARDQRWLAMVRTVIEEFGGERLDLIVRCRLVDDVFLVEGRDLPATRPREELILLDRDALRCCEILHRVDREGVVAMAVRLPLDGSR